MTSIFKEFLSAENGGTTVDMTMLMAALIGLAIAVTTQVSGGIGNLTSDLETVLVEKGADAAW